MERSIGRIIASALGAGFLLAGIIGFINHDLMGMHLSTSHNLVHLISGILAIYIGLKGSLMAVRIFNLAFGAVYSLLGVAGFIAGGQAEPTAGVPGPGGPYLWKVIAGLLELGTVDHLIHILLGVLFIIGGLMTKPLLNDKKRATTVW
jgi:hypothetical protein